MCVTRLRARDAFDRVMIAAHGSSATKVHKELGRGWPVGLGVRVEGVQCRSLNTYQDRCPRFVI